MANNTYSQIQALADTELSEQLAQAQIELTQIRFEHAVKGSVTQKEIREQKRKIAHIQTELRSRELSKLSDAEQARRSKIRHRRSKG